jgi:hypothetical protein
VAGRAAIAPPLRNKLDLDGMPVAIPIAALARNLL